MGNLNSCFDHERIKASSEKIQTIYNDAYITSFSTDISNLIANLSSEDETHGVLSTQIEALEAMPTTLNKAIEEIEVLSNGMKESIEAYDEAEGSMFLFLNDLSAIIANTLGNETVANYIKDGKVTKDTLATTIDDFITGATEEVTKFMSEYAKYLDTNCPSPYKNSKEWREALIDTYKKLGYSSYDAEELADLRMTKWRLNQTGADVSKNAISAVATTEFQDLSKDVRNDYNELVNNYKDLGVTDEQAKELATAESELEDSITYANENPSDISARQTVSENRQKLEALKEKYGITEQKPEGQTPATPDNNDDGGNQNTPDSDDNNGPGNGSDSGEGDGDSNIKARVEPNPPAPPSQNKNTSSDVPEETPVKEEEKEPTIIEEEEKVPETPSEEKPSTTPEPETPPSNNNSNNNQTNTGENTNNSGVVNNTPSTGGNTNNGNNYYAPSNNNGGGNYNSGASSNTPTTGTGTPNENASTTTPSAPESDAGINDNSGETLDVISIDKDGGKSSASTSSNDGGSVVPTILGVGVAGAAAVAGAKILHDKKKKENEYIYEEDGSTESDNSFANLESYTGDDTVDTTDTMSPGKYRAGSANNLVLEGSPSDIKIDESIADIPNQKEELE